MDSTILFHVKDPLYAGMGMKSLNKSLMAINNPYLSKQFYLRPDLLQYNQVDHIQGMFCKMEYQMDLKNTINPRFRLGSLAYTEWMEGKRLFPY